MTLEPRTCDGIAAPSGAPTGRYFSPLWVRATRHGYRIPIVSLSARRSQRRLQPVREAGVHRPREADRGSISDSLFEWQGPHLAPQDLRVSAPAHVGGMEHQLDPAAREQPGSGLDERAAERHVHDTNLASGSDDRPHLPARIRHVRPRELPAVSTGIHRGTQMAVTKSNRRPRTRPVAPRTRSASWRRPRPRT